MKLSRLIKNSLGMALVMACGAAAQTGWTSLTPSQDSRVIYVSSSSGNDANNGLSPGAPKRTVAAGYALVRNGYPDQLLLKKGDTFYETIQWQKSGRSPTEMSVMGSYGAGARPMLLTGSVNAITSYNTLNHFALVGIAMKAHTWAGQLPPGQDPAAVVIVAAGDNLLIEDCYVESYSNGLIVQGYPGVRTNTRIRRNVIVDPIRLDPNNGSTNMFMAQYDGVLIEENVFDNSIANETQRGAMLSHSIYLGEGNPANNIIRGNIAHNGGRTNFNIRSGGLIENNLSIRGAQGITCGIHYAPTWVSATVRQNVIIESRNNQNGQELGFGLSFEKVQHVDLDSNLICNSTDGSDSKAIALNIDTRAAQIRNNIIYNWRAPSEPSWGNDTIYIWGTPAGPISITNNQVQQSSNTHLVSFNSPNGPGCIVTLSGNRYHSGRPNGYWFQPNSGTDLTFAQWTGQMGETGSQLTQISYPAPNRTIGSYHASIGGSANTDSFMAEARRQSKDYWRPAYTAAAVNNYMRAGFGQGQVTPCRADMNHDGQLNVADFTGFLQAFAARDPIADYNEDSQFTSADFAAFLQAFGIGCL
jgi:hypothetical protein